MLSGIVGVADRLPIALTFAVLLSSIVPSLRLSWPVRCSARVCVLVSEALKSYSSLSSEMPPVGRSEAQPDSTGAWLSRLLASAWRHEAVSDFRNEAGEVVGMPAMVMPFELAPAVELQGIRAGDKVEVRFAVTWSPPSVKVEELRKLPDDVQLQFGGGPTTPEKK